MLRSQYFQFSSYGSSKGLTVVSLTIHPFIHSQGSINAIGRYLRAVMQDVPEKATNHWKTTCSRKRPNVSALIGYQFAQYFDSVPIASYLSTPFGTSKSKK